MVGSMWVGPSPERVVGSARLSVWAVKVEPPVTRVQLGYRCRERDHRGDDSFGLGPAVGGGGARKSTLCLGSVAGVGSGGVSVGLGGDGVSGVMVRRWLNLFICIGRNTWR